MKRISTILMSLSAILLLASCERGALGNENNNASNSGMIWDIAGVELVLVVSDAQGNNLFDESTPGNWLETPFTAKFDGQVFSWPHSLPWAGTKAYLAHLDGFYIFPQWYMQTDEVYLRFGELEGTKKWDTDLTIFWPDGSMDTIRIQHSFRWDEHGYPEIYTGYKVNGATVDGRIIRIKK